MDASKLLIIVPARGGSKGLPGKNARTLGDLPLLGWTAKAIQQSGLSSAHCLLSTDSKEIASIGESVGLMAPFLRPDELATDTASSVDVTFHCMDWLEEKNGIKIEYIMLLQPTSPFRPPTIIRDAFTAISSENADAAVGVKPIDRALNTLFYSNDDFYMDPVEQLDDVITRRQDVRTLYTPNGSMYAIKSQVLYEQKTFFPQSMRGIPLNQIESLDIDDKVDWAIAEAVVQSKLTWRSNLKRSQ